MAADPSNIKTVEYNSSNMDVVLIDHVPEYDQVEYDIDDNKQLEKYIDAIEKICRSSFEYSKYTKYLRTYMDMNKCSVFENINNIETTKIKIHIHHSPITLYEIAVIILNKRKYYYEDLDPEMVAKEVMYVHYCLLIGLIPLCETVHTLVHNEFYFIPNSKVMGKYNDFIKLYEPWVPWQIKEKLNRIEEFTKIADDDMNKAILEPHYIYLEFAGAYKLPRMEDLLFILQNRMNTLKENNFIMDCQKEDNKISLPFIVWNK